MATNRNKRSLTLNLSSKKGQKIARQLISKSDILVENFKVGNLSKYHLSYDDLRDEYPSLIYCSITGFGQTGPLAEKPGYDFMAQGMGGLMSITREAKPALESRSPVKIETKFKSTNRATKHKIAA